MKNRKIDKMESLKLVCKIYFKNYTVVYIGETSQKLKKKKESRNMTTEAFAKGTL